MEEFERCFQKIDKSHTGFISINEIGSFLRATGLNPTMNIIKEITEWLNEFSKLIFSLLNSSYGLVFISGKFEDGLFILSLDLDFDQNLRKWNKLTKNI